MELLEHTAPRSPSFVEVIKFGCLWRFQTSPCVRSVFEYRRHGTEPLARKATHEQHYDGVSMKDGPLDKGGLTFACVAVRCSSFKPAVPQILVCIFIPFWTSRWVFLVTAW